MLSKTVVLDNYSNLETTIDNRFGKRLSDFLTVEELEKTNFKVKEEYRDKWVPKKEWTERNIIQQLLSDAEFGKEKAKDERGISSALMTEVCEAWLYILEDDELKPNKWGYNLLFFQEILDKYCPLNTNRNGDGVHTFKFNKNYAHLYNITDVSPNGIVYFYNNRRYDTWKLQDAIAIQKELPPLEDFNRTIFQDIKNKFYLISPYVLGRIIYNLYYGNLPQIINEWGKYDC